MILFWWLWWASGEALQYAARRYVLGLDWW
jgi:hypothetical protein